MGKNGENFLCVKGGAVGRGVGKRDTCYGYFYLLKIYSLRFNFNVFIRLLSNKSPSNQKHNSS